MTDFPSSPVTETLDQFLDAALRHAEGLQAQLTKPEWRPSRAHVEQARNTIRKIVEKVRDHSRLPDMARLSASEAACYRWPEDTAEHRAMRAAYMDGAASTAGLAQRQQQLQEAVAAAHAAFEAIPIGYPLQQNGRTIDHTLLNEAKRLCELAVADTSTDQKGNANG